MDCSIGKKGRFMHKILKFKEEIELFLGAASIPAINVFASLVLEGDRLSLLLRKTIMIDISNTLKYLTI